MRRIIVSTVALLALAISAAAFAETKKDAAAGVTYDVPAGFKVTESAGMTELDDPKEEMAFFLMPTTNENKDKDVKKLEGVLNSLVKDVKQVGEPSQGKYNGMTAIQIKSTGTYKGKPVNVTLRFYNTPTGKIFVAVGMYLADKKEALKGTFNGFYSSIKPAA